MEGRRSFSNACETGAIFHLPRCSIPEGHFGSGGRSAPDPACLWNGMKACLSPRTSVSTGRSDDIPRIHDAEPAARGARTALCSRGPDPLWVRSAAKTAPGAPRPSLVGLTPCSLPRLTAMGWGPRYTVFFKRMHGGSGTHLRPQSFCAFVSVTQRATNLIMNSDEFLFLTLFSLF
jgi:hypothetical protein